MAEGDKRLTAIELEWTAEQKRLIGQITEESTGLIIGIVTEADSVPNEFGGLEASEADRRLVNILHETSGEVLGRLAGTDLDTTKFASVIGIAANW